MFPMPMLHPLSIPRDALWFANQILFRQNTVALMFVFSAHQTWTESFDSLVLKGQPLSILYNELMEVRHIRCYEWLILVIPFTYLCGSHVQPGGIQAVTFDSCLQIT